ncbi:UNVERIFIED_CONTAM: rubrerythrin [Murimonas intestini]|uniref:Rubrerythrin n=2 Tax=Murimonas intestini TaxID=1337051 RepID=A0AB73T586_9FIRM
MAVWGNNKACIKFRAGKEDIMTVDFKTSQTKDNLMRAFAGESQARNRYTFAASQAKKEKLQVIEAVFRFTADQERQHARVFYSYLKELAGQTITVDGGYPVDIYPDVKDLLRAAQHNEYEEHDDVYKKFGEVAKEEGFHKVAGAFHMIAEIEKTHGDRFKKFADYMDENKLFVSDVEEGWMCLECGFIYQGKEAPEKCPVCSHDQGYFIRLSLAPYQD